MRNPPDRCPQGITERMRTCRFTYTILFLLFSLLGLSARNTARIEFAETEHDWGNISEQEEVVTCDFVFTNTGDAPLVILSATANCGCTAAEYTQAPVAPGGQGTIRVEFYPLGKSGEFLKRVKVKTNVPGKMRNVMLSVRGVVIPSLK